MKSILLILISLITGCVNNTKQPIPKEQHEYQVHMGSHHLINASSIKEAQLFIDAQSASHGGKMRIIYTGNNTPLPEHLK